MKQGFDFASTLVGAAFFLVPQVFVAAADAPRPTGPAQPERADAETRGVVEGVIVFRGEAPQSPLADDAGVHRDLLQVDPASRGLRNVVVWLARSKASARERRAEITPAAPLTTKPALMDQRDHQFLPRVLAVCSGQSVKFTNSDAANHNVRASAPHPSNEFNVVTGVNGSYTHRFQADAEQRPVRLDCDIHPWMRGWIYVFDHPYFAVTDEHGRFRIDSVPAGQYTLAVRQPDIKYAHDETTAVAKTLLTRVQIEIRAQDLTKPKE